MAALLGSAPLIAVGAIFVAGLGLLSAWRDTLDDPGMTTEVALLLAYLIGVMCAHSQPVAAALAVSATVLLAARDSLHHLSRQWLQPGEARDGLVLAALALLVVPLVPDQPLWGDALNPQVVARLLVVLLLIQSVAHLGRRLMKARHALGLASLASGFVSSTATIATLGIQARSTPAQARLQAGAAVLSCTATMMQLLVVTATVQPAWLLHMAPPAGAAALVALAWGAWLMRPASDSAGATQENATPDGSTENATAVMTPTPLSVAPSQSAAPELHAEASPMDDSRMFKLRDTALVAILLTAVQAAVHGLRLAFGDAGLLAGTLLAALADLHAAAAAVLLQGTPADATLAQALMAAVLVHATSKSVVAITSGGWRFAKYALPGIWGHSLMFAGCLLLR